MEDEGLHPWSNQRTMKTKTSHEYQCSECSRGFETESGMESHIWNVHPDEWLLRPVDLKTDSRGYEVWRHAYDGEEVLVYHHQLLAISDGHDPHDVFSGNVVHHGSDGNPRIPEYEAPWANWSGNLEVMSRGGHMKHHYAALEDDLLEELQRLSDTLNRTPKMMDMDEHGAYSADTYANCFDSWNEALEEAGLELNHRMSIPRRELIDELIRLSNELDKTPSASNVRKHGKFSVKIYKQRFGSINHALLAAGLMPREQYTRKPKRCMNGSPEKGNVLADWS